jgi:hypothetical protein
MSRKSTPGMWTESIDKDLLREKIEQAKDQEQACLYRLRTLKARVDEAGESIPRASLRPKRKRLTKDPVKITNLYQHVVPADEFDAGSISLEYTPKYRKSMNRNPHTEDLILSSPANIIEDREKVGRNTPSFDPHKARKLFEKANKNWLMLRMKPIKGPTSGVNNSLADRPDIKIMTPGSGGGNR